jgi:TRAP-type C4-dicarboxylate transport system permease small subunit
MAEDAGQPAAGPRPGILMRLAGRLASLEEALAIFCLIGVAAMVNLQSIDRVRPDPFIWTEEMARAFQIWLSYLALGVVTHHGLHIGIDAITVRLRGLLRLAVLTAIELLNAAVFGFLAVQGYGLVKASAGMELVSTEFPVALIIWPLVIGSGLATLHSLLRCLDRLVTPAHDTAPAVAPIPKDA